MAVELGLAGHGERCHGCPVAERCDFELDLAEDEKLKELYLDAESYDGYFRDRCVFADDITIEDTMQVQARYASGATLNYTLVAYSPWEGLEVKFHGTKGELTHRHVEVHGVFGGKRDMPPARNRSTTNCISPANRPRMCRSGAGTAATAAPTRSCSAMSSTRPTWRRDQYGRAASEIMGAWSILTGIAANASIASGGVIDVDAMLRENGVELGRPS